MRSGLDRYLMAPKSTKRVVKPARLSEAEVEKLLEDHLKLQDRFLDLKAEVEASSGYITDVLSDSGISTESTIVAGRMRAKRQKSFRFKINGKSDRADIDKVAVREPYEYIKIWAV